VGVYLRARYKPIHERLHPDRAPGDLLPTIRRDRLEAEGPAVMYQHRAELAREAAMFATLAVARLVRRRFAAFLIALGVGDRLRAVGSDTTRRRPSAAGPARWSGSYKYYPDDLYF
jgi:hypothetical protein